MVYIKSEKQISAIRKSNEIVAEALKFIEKFIEPGIETKVLDREIENFILKKRPNRLSKVCMVFQRLPVFRLMMWWCMGFLASTN